MNHNSITVFEHETLTRSSLAPGQLEALEKFHGDGSPYFSLIHNGVKFCEYVGVIQVGNTLIEILPKADKQGKNQEWRSMLIDMLKTVGSFDLRAPSSSSLGLKSNSILELYFEIFINEVEYLLHRGLLKQYRKKTGNLTTLKGAIKFNHHLRLNLIHKERFFVEHSTYDIEHKIHFILYKTIKLIEKINSNSKLKSRISSLLLNFPEMPNIKVDDGTFAKLSTGRKTQPYAKALEISKLLLLNYHPDLSHGSNHVLALMFDMNVLWEQFVYHALRKQMRYSDQKFTISAQTEKYFWKPNHGRRSKIRPDIVINENKDSCVVLDTKWKNLNGYNPSSDDLRQMYVYHEYYEANKVALMYPGNDQYFKKGLYLDPINHRETDKECSIIPLPVVKDNVRVWQEKIFERFLQWFEK
jgi:5-methylcytosine-specific restriction enzyme subunit McrC